MMKTISCALFLILSLSVRAQDVKVEYITPKIVRVQWAADGQLQGNGTGACIWEKQKDIYKSEELTVEIDNGTVMFIDGKTGKTLLTEQWRRAEPMVKERIVYDDSSAHMEETANGKVTVKDIIRRDTIGLSTRYISHFSCPDTKALYGLGAHMEDYMNLLGKTLWLTQHNLKITVPMLISPQGYGLLFDAGCAMKYSSSGKAFTMQMEAARQIDYYFIKGDRMEEVVEGYRYLTGKVQMLPLYAFGYIQSKERYVSSDDLLSTMREYRRRHVCAE